jgi:ADP-dependent NAD(P)H-hydrate dehydratase / NAD(P)H-hydrate epimerase
VNAINDSRRPVVAVDIPSGLSAESAEIPGPAIRATLTVTFGAPKVPLVLPPAESLAGRLIVADIGIQQSCIDRVGGRRIDLLTLGEMRAFLRPRRPDSHKGDFGRIVIVAGSRGKTGAAALAGMAALRSGAGLVTIATPASCQPVVASLAPEFMTEAVAETSDGTIAADAIDRVLDLDADVIAAGPGLGQTPAVRSFVDALLRRATVPLILDADGLNAVVGETERLRGRATREVVITPHPGEMARLTGRSIQDVQANRLDVAAEFAATHGVVVILKGHRTVIATPDGGLSINPTGNPGMATGGTGDVLTGMIAGWYGQLRDVMSASKLAVYLHGLAGDLAECDAGEAALVASDLISHIGPAVRALGDDACRHT